MRLKALEPGIEMLIEIPNGGALRPLLESPHATELNCIGAAVMLMV